MIPIYRIPNWSNFQQYRDRKPTWIKLHKSLLDNRAFQKLPLSARAMLPMLWLLASENDDVNSGNIELSNEDIAFRLRVTEAEVEKNMETLLSCCFIELVRSDTENYEELPRVETEAYKKETDNRAHIKAIWKQLWEAYPRQRRGSEAKALIAWESAIKRASPEDILAGCLRYASSNEVSKGYAKGCQAWLNDDGWTYCSPQATTPPSAKPQAGVIVL